MARVAVISLLLARRSSSECVWQRGLVGGEAVASPQQQAQLFWEEGCLVLEVVICHQMAGLMVLVAATLLPMQLACRSPNVRPATTRLE